MTGNRVRTAWQEAKGALAAVPGFWTNLWSNFRDGVYMASAILPSILSVGLIGLLLAKYTPVFDWLGYLFVPFTWATQMAEPVLAGKAISLGIVEMFLPAIAAADIGSPVTRLVIAVVSVSQIIFFSALVPCVLATDIPIRIWQMVVIWVERVVLTILLAAPLAHLLVLSLIHI